MPKLHHNCTLCGSTNLGVLKKEYSHAYLVRCQDCNFVFGERIPTGEELSAHYAGYPRNTSISPLTIKRYEELLQQFEPYRRNNRLLDVGCGDAHFLEVAKRKGWNVYGTEYTASACQPGRDKGIQIHEGLLQSYTPGFEFDVITSFEVLEHITDCTDHVKSVAKLLRRGGLYYFTTPNFNSFSRRWLGGKWKIIEYPEHLSYFTPSTSTKLLIDAGMQKLKLISTGVTLRQFPQGDVHYAQSEEELIKSIESSGGLRMLKNVINSLLTLTNLGDSLKGYFVKP